MHQSSRILLSKTYLRRVHTNTIAELFFLAPKNVMREIRTRRWVIGGIESLAEDVFLHSIFGDHLFLGIDGHGDAKHCLVPNSTPASHTPHPPPSTSPP